MLPSVGLLASLIYWRCKHFRLCLIPDCFFFFIFSNANIQADNSKSTQAPQCLPSLVLRILSPATCWQHRMNLDIVSTDYYTTSQIPTWQGQRSLPITPSAPSHSLWFYFWEYPHSSLTSSQFSTVCYSPRSLTSLPTVWTHCPSLESFSFFMPFSPLSVHYLACTTSRSC